MFSLALLSGGRSTRMGQDKALMPFLGRPLIMRILERLSMEADEVILSTNHPENYAFLGLLTIRDIVPDCGALGGLHAALNTAKKPFVAVVACDMPFASQTLFQYECELLARTEADVVIPSTPDGLEPLHAVYRRETCLPAVLAGLKAGKLKMTSWLTEVKARTVGTEEIKLFDPKGLAFWNLNTPEEFKQAETYARMEAA